MLYTNSLKEKFFQPQFVLLISIIAASLYSLYATIRFSGDKLFNQYYYVVPIIIPFTIFLLYRAEGFGQRKWIQWLIDSAVVITAMWRVIGAVCFGTYAFFNVLYFYGQFVFRRNRNGNCDDRGTLLKIICLERLD